MDSSDTLDPAALDAFIDKWTGVEGSERANYQLFLTQLCTLLELPQPNPAPRDPQRDHPATG